MLRIIWGTIFIGASIFNLSYTMFQPGLYQDIANLSLLPIYTDLIENYIIENPIIFTSLLVVFEFITGWLILSKGVSVKFGLIASLIFTLSIIPAIVPYTYVNIILAIIPLFLLRKKYTDSIWNLLKRKKHDLGKSA